MGLSWEAEMDVDGLMARAQDGLQGSRSFGPVVESGGVTVIPVAWVVGAGGGGSGEGPEGSANAGKGGGGGFVSLSWPIGAYVIKDGQVSWMPALDATRIAAAAIGIVAAVVKVRSLRRRD